MPKIANLTNEVLDNTFFRHVLATGSQSQIVIMDLKPGEEIGSETHAGSDQILYLVRGRGTYELNETMEAFEQGDCVLVPAGTRHNFTAAADMGMKIVTIYAPATHPDGLIHKTKAEAGSD